MATPIPTIHLNGSSGERLRDDTRTAMRAVSVAIDALCEAAPNARDYYVQGPDAWAAAERAHVARLDRLRVVRDELTHIYSAILDQLDARKQRNP